MSDKSSIEIRPATDEEIAMWRGLSALALERHGSLGQAWITLDIRKTQLDALLARIESDRATIAELRETNARLNRRVTKAEGIVLAKARDESAAGRSLGRALANAACSALRAQNADLLAALERLDDGQGEPMTTSRARVKPLEWSFGSYAWVAESCFGSYVAADDGSAKFANERCANHRGDGLEGAKAACQRDHDACVRALLIIEEEHDQR